MSPTSAILENAAGTALGGGVLAFAGSVMVAYADEYVEKHGDAAEGRLAKSMRPLVGLSLVLLGLAVAAILSARVTSGLPATLLIAFFALLLLSTFGISFYVVSATFSVQRACAQAHTRVEVVGDADARRPSRHHTSVQAATLMVAAVAAIWALRRLRG